jgi:hypothetical protein
MVLLYLILILTLFIYLVEHLKHWLSSDRSCDLVYPDCALETEVESRMWKFLLTRINLLQRAYPTTLEVSSHEYSEVTVCKVFINVFCSNNEPNFWNHRKTISVCVNFSPWISPLFFIPEHWNFVTHSKNLQEVILRFCPGLLGVRHVFILLSDF